MKIGVVSDTHSKKIPAQLLEELRSVDYIIHAGDFCSLKDFEVFNKIKEVKAVYGNMDEPLLKKKLPEQQIFKLEGLQFGLYHGDGPADKVVGSVQSKFKGKQLDVIIFGHSHQPYNEKKGGTLFFNPGSPNDTLFAPYLSYGILEVNKGSVSGKIVKIGEK